MSLDIRYSPLAVREMNEIADYLAQQSPRLGLRFLKAVEDTCTQLADMPEMASRYESENPRLADLRVWAVHGFPNHLVFFRIKQSYLEIVEVLYGGRDLEKLL